MVYFLKIPETLLLIFHLDVEKYVTVKHFNNNAAAIMIWIWTKGPKGAVAGCVRACTWGVRSSETRGFQLPLNLSAAFQSLRTKP